MTNLFYLLPQLISGILSHINWRDVVGISKCGRVLGWTFLLIYLLIYLFILLFLFNLFVFESLHIIHFEFILLFLTGVNSLFL